MLSVLFLQSFHPDLIQVVFLYCSLFILILIFHLFMLHTFCNFLTILQCFSFFKLFISSFNFLFVSFYWPIFNLTDSFFGHVKSIDEPFRGISYSCYSVLISSISFWFLEFPFLCLHHPSVLVCCPIFPLQTFVY